MDPLGYNTWSPTPRSASRARLEALTGIVADDMVDTLGWHNAWPGRRLAAQFCRPAARRIAACIQTCDQVVSQRGLYTGAVWSLQRLAVDLAVTDQAYLPAQGPVLIAANHPGLCDALALVAAAQRQDLRILAMDRPYFRLMDGVSRHLIFTPEGGQERLTALHQVARHLRQGGAVLVFPAGRIEPDPSVLPGALESLQCWSLSLGVVARMVGDTRIVPAIVSGVLSPSVARHPLTVLRRQPRDRQRLASLLQALAFSSRPVTVRVAFGPPLAARELRETGADSPAISRMVADRARRLLRATA